MKRVCLGQDLCLANRPCALAETEPPKERRTGRAARVALWTGGVPALLALAFAGGYYYQNYQRQQQRLAGARAHPLKPQRLTLVLSTRTGDAPGPPATTFKDAELVSAKYLKWSATFDNELAGVGDDEKVERRSYDRGGNQIASSDAERMAGKNDKSVGFSGVALMPDTAATTHGQYKVAFYLGDRALGRQGFTVNEDVAAKAKAEAALRAQITRAHPAASRTFQDCGDCPEMVVIPAGGFLMGDETWRPQHRATIYYEFAVSRFPVTRDEYGRFVSASGYDAGTYWKKPRFNQTGKDPAVGIGWDDARAYVRWLGQKTGQSYRLLSESEYEYAERAGTTTAHWWGDSDADLCKYANGNPCNHNGTVPVGSYPANAFGLYDTAGNVFEWTEDCWHKTYDGAPTDGSAWTTGDCSGRVVRGGSWSSNAGYLRSANRMRGITGYRSYYFSFGFRVARTM